MPLFRFALKQGLKTISDLDGHEFPDEAAAREHAMIVGRELMRNRERLARHWRIEIWNDSCVPIDEVHLISLDDVLQHFPAAVRASIEGFHRSSTSLADAISDVRVSLLQIRATLARADTGPYLATIDGHCL